MQNLNERGGRNAVAALVFVCVNASLIQTVVLPIQSDLPQLIGAPMAQTSWVVTAAIAAGCASAPISGRLGDIHGKRRVSLLLLLILAAGSVMAALAPSIGLLIAARALQGLAIGLVPLSVSIIKSVAQPERLPGSLGLVSGAMGVGSALGFPVGAALNVLWGWQSMFWFSTLAALIAITWTAVAVPSDGRPAAASFDWIGAIGTFAGSTGLIIGIGGPFDGQSQLVQGITATAGAVLLAAAIVHMARSRTPLIDVRASIRRELMLANAMSYLLNFGIMSTLVVFPHLLNAAAISPLAVGLVMMSCGLSQAIGAPPLAQATRNQPIQAVAALGCGGSAVGIGLAILFGSSSWAILWANVVLGLGFGLAFAALPRIVMASTHVNQLAAANGLNAQIRMFGTASAAAIVGALMSQHSPATVSNLTTPLLLALSAAIAATGLSLLLFRGAQRQRRTP
ncbi:MFS transporter [Paenarthrobacter aromaticivorans]|uniref:MFS transporter n=1 Tax=Paenarthrobacter aromaticivorans TaxID=2849150 RepID=A0ABS6I9U6_9MICC|nr:MFS transporter [Paenarthrobacter sp. MMS21-TAE1-1]MBU8868496.1 MFS transporter [Paenarthrobacter sp. MMS21-TAE1-1]